MISTVQTILSPDMIPASTKTSPIVIDLNGDGIKTISRKNGKTYFDLDNNKFAENTSWIDKNDGILINKTLITNSINKRKRTIWKSYFTKRWKLG